MKRPPGWKPRWDRARGNPYFLQAPVWGWEDTVAHLTADPRPWPEAMVVTDLRWYVFTGTPLPGRPTLSARWHWSDKDITFVLGHPELWWVDEKRNGPAPKGRADLETRINVRKRMFQRPEVQDGSRTEGESSRIGPGEEQDDDGITVVYDEDGTGRGQDEDDRGSGQAHARVHQRKGENDRDQSMNPLTPAGGMTNRRTRERERLGRISWVRDHTLAMLVQLEADGRDEQLAEQLEAYRGARQGIVDTMKMYLEGWETKDIYGRRVRRRNAPDAPIGIREREIAIGLQQAAASFRPSDRAPMAPILPFYSDESDDNE